MGRGVQNKARRAHSIKALSGHHDSDGAWNHGSWEVHTDHNWPRRPGRMYTTESRMAAINLRKMINV